MKILIIRRDNIGDLICTTPLFEAIRQQYPQAFIAALVNSYNAPAIEGNPHLNAIFAYTKGKHADGEAVWQAYWRRAKLLWQLRQMNFDYVILASSGFAGRALKLAKLLAPKHIVGFVTDKASSEKLTCPFHTAKAASCTKPRTCPACCRRSKFLARFREALTVTANAVLAKQLQNQLPANLVQGKGPLVALHISARKEKQRWPVSFCQFCRTRC